MQPKNCPCCAEPTFVKTTMSDKGEKIKTVHCNNPDCETQWIRQLVHFTGEKALDIIGLSQGILEKLVSEGYLQSFCDLFYLDKHQDEIIKLKGFGKKLFDKIWDAIEAKREISFERFLICVDIPMVGNDASGKICKRFSRDIEAFEDAVTNNFDFTTLEGIGPVISQNICDWFASEENRALWNDLKKIISIKNEEETNMSIEKQGYFTGKTVVITGTLMRDGKHITKDEATEMLLSYGAHREERVTKKTDLVVYGESAGSKLEKAEKLGIATMDAETFFEKLQ